MRTIAGLEHPRTGRITLDEEVWLDVTRGIDRRPEHRRVGYLPQDYGLFPHLSVAGNVRFAARGDRPDLLERLAIAHLADARPGQLSGGERQRAALARALARDPRVLLLDEPFGALDTITRRQVRDELTEILRLLALPTLLVTHAFEDATALADRLGVIDHGRILQLGPPQEIMRRPVDATVAALAGANVLEGRATPTGAGSEIEIAGGGKLRSSTAATGPVQVAVHPWALELVPVTEAAFIDTIVSTREEGGRLVVRLTRVIARVPLTADGQPRFEPGAAIGLHASPADVHVLGPETQSAAAATRS